ncbi:hypothetical protein AGR7A_pAt20054 [Agrobacterium deltaense NCPPB 1641]|uniref:Uncharacterized protein n=1 Tax=Agrobacterium deltaense NCPPB 1641 TaxID=1183425 RepID=A0A1S7U814_9HYPH|nr:hypothetical protein AGR7A_pAt20054 [Agrobacterium deltaense NCPPB 1641]
MARPDGVPSGRAIPQSEKVEPDDDIGKPHIRDHLDRSYERRNRKVSRQHTLRAMALRWRELRRLWLVLLRP